MSLDSPRIMLVQEGDGGTGLAAVIAREAGCHYLLGVET